MERPKKNLTTKLSGLGGGGGGGGGVRLYKLVGGGS